MTVTINTATGTPPFNIWVANNCNANSTSIFIDTIQSVPYTFTLPPSYQDVPFVVKLTDELRLRQNYVRPLPITTVHLLVMGLAILLHIPFPLLYIMVELNGFHRIMVVYNG